MNNNGQVNITEEELREIERDANSNRQSDLDNYENIGDYSYYSGKKW